jgi:hypothetical protein
MVYTRLSDMGIPQTLHQEQGGLSGQQQQGIELRTLGNAQR